MNAMIGKKRNLKPRTRQYSNAIHACPDGDCPELDHLDVADVGSLRLFPELFGLSSPNGKANGASEDDDGGDDEQCSFAGLDISELEKYANEPVDWIVHGVFSSDQPIIFGAASKCTKTLHLADLCVALAKPKRRGKSRKWLGRYEIPKRRRVLFITSESNKRAMAKLFDKCVKAHDTTLKQMKGYLRVETIETPRLVDPWDLEALKQDVELHEFDVVILDPLYPSLVGMDANRLEERGAAIRDLYQAVQPATVIISHHFTKSAARSYGDRPYLEDLSGAGLAESAGNWWLMKRNVPYAGDHVHDLVVTYGGRDGQSGLIRIEFDEEKWEFDVEDYEEYRLYKMTVDSNEKAKKAAKQLEIDSNALEAYLAEVSSPKAKTTIRDNGPLSAKRFNRAFDSLVKEGVVVKSTYKDSQNRKHDGWWLATTQYNSSIDADEEKSE